MFDIVSLDIFPIFSRLDDLNEEMQQQSLTRAHLVGKKCFKYILIRILGLLALAQI